MLSNDDEPLLEEAPEFEEEEEEIPEGDDEPGDGESEASKIPKINSDTEVSALRAKIAQAEEDADNARREAAKERFEREKAQYLTCKQHVEKLQGEDKYIRSHIRSLELELEEAKASGDTAKVRAIRDQIDEKNDIRDKISAEVTKYAPVLNNVPQEKEFKATPKKEESEGKLSEIGKIRLNDWMEANKGWYDNPAHAAKRAKANELCKKLTSEGYDIGSAVFWKYIDDEISKSEPGKRRSAPVMRGSVNGSEVTVKKKQDTQALELTNQILVQMGFTARDKESDTFKRKSASVYKTVTRRLAREKSKRSA